MQQLSCTECGFVARGETKEDAMKQLSAHAGTAHAPASMVAKMESPK